MATASVIALDRATDYGKASPANLAKIAKWAGEITVDLLSHNQGRFKCLSRSTVFTFAAGEKSKRLPAEFNSIMRTGAQVDAAEGGEFVAKMEFVPKANYYRRIAEGRYSGFRIGYIEELPSGSDGPGLYLILGEAPTETIYVDFPYYRRPTADDTDLITNVAAINAGVDSKAAEFIGAERASYAIAIYEKMKSGFNEDPERTASHVVVEPNRRTGKHNRMMHIIGGGG